MQRLFVLTVTYATASPVASSCANCAIALQVSVVVVTASSSQSIEFETNMQRPSYLEQVLSDKGVNVTVKSFSAKAKKAGMSKKKQLVLALVLFIILVLSMGLLAKFLCCNGSEDKKSSYGA